MRFTSMPWLRYIFYSFTHSLTSGLPSTKSITSASSRSIHVNTAMDPVIRSFRQEVDAKIQHILLERRMANNNNPQAREISVESCSTIRPGFLSRGPTPSEAAVSGMSGMQDGAQDTMDFEMNDSNHEEQEQQREPVDAQREARDYRCNRLRDNILIRYIRKVAGW